MMMRTMVLCLFPAFFSGFWSGCIDCGGAYTTAQTWQEPGLYDRMPKNETAGYEVIWYETIGVKKAWKLVEVGTPLKEVFSLRVEASNETLVMIDRERPGPTDAEIYARIERAFAELNLGPLTLAQDTDFPEWQYQCA